MTKWYDAIRSLWAPGKTAGEGGDYIDVEAEEAKQAVPGRLASAKDRFLTRLRKGSKRDQQIAALQLGYNEMLGLIRSIRGHLESQTQAQGRLLETLDHLPDAVESLKSVGRSSEQQSEVLQLLRRQLESSVGHDEKLIDSMNRFNQTLELMDQTSRNSAQTMTRLAERTRESEDLLGGILERSEKRLMVVIGLLAVLTLVVAGSGLYLGIAAYRARSAPGETPAPVAITEHAISGLAPEPAVEEPVTESSEPEEVLDEEYAEPAYEEPSEEVTPPPRARRRFLFFRR
ncbi:MAG: hypothetical protein JXB04_12090 [Kiritimatiellae bacterium]|nr:hypothetical protein [Kiritimatiellia bacterium]